MFHVHNNLFKSWDKDKRCYGNATDNFKVERSARKKCAEFTKRCAEFSSCKHRISIFWHRNLTTLAMSIHLSRFTAKLGTFGLDLCLGVGLSMFLCILCWFCEFGCQLIACKNSSLKWTVRCQVECCCLLTPYLHFRELHVMCFYRPTSACLIIIIIIY